MKKLSAYVGVVILVGSTAACAGRPDTDSIPIGEDVMVTRADGGVLEGTITARDGENLVVTTGTTTRSIPKTQIADLRVLNEAAPTPLPAAARFREYTVPSGTRLSLSLVSALDSATDQVGQSVNATLREAVSIRGTEVLPAGSPVTGTVSAVEGSAKVKGLASMTVHFTSVAAADRDDRYAIDATYSETAEATKGEDATKIAVGAGAGAAIGGLLGGRGGAARGAAVGGGAGTAVVLATTGREVRHAAGTTLVATLRSDLDVKIPID